MRSRIRVAVDMTEGEIRRLAQTDEKVAHPLNGREDPLNSLSDVADIH